VVLTVAVTQAERLAARQPTQASLNYPMAQRTAA
jgi:hypothetical protein